MTGLQPAVGRFWVYEKVMQKGANKAYCTSFRAAVAFAAMWAQQTGTECFITEEVKQYNSKGELETGQRVYGVAKGGGLPELMTMPAPYTGAEEKNGRAAALDLDVR